MADPATIRESFERNVRAVTLKPSRAQSTATTKIRLRDGTTCDIEHGDWELTADVGTAQGGNGAGPGPGILERAALGSCLAMGYATRAARHEVPLDDVTVEVESEFDARGMLGVEDQPPGFTRLLYRVTIESPASEAEIRRIIDEADAHSPVRDDFSRPLPIDREVTIIRTTEQTHEA